MEAVLLEIVIEVDLQQFKHNADVAMMGKTLVCSHKVELLSIHFAQCCQDIHLDLPLLAIRGEILQDLHGHYFIGVLLPAFQHLTKGTAT